MPTYVAFLRAVNVGGRYCRMADLRQHLEASGLTEVQTYIQTGNVRLRTPMRSPAKVEAHVERVLAEGFGFEVPTAVFTPAELSEVYDDATRFATPEVDALADRRGVPVSQFVSFFKAGSAPVGEPAERLAAWGGTPDGEGEAAIAVGRAVHVRVAGTMLDARVFGAFKKPLAPGTVRNLAVLTTLAERWGA